MNEQLEKLIDLAIADGKITEKERKVILKKASELGVDTDEVEMILDGKLHQLESSKPKQKKKVGNIKTCPACGAPVKAMTLVCSDCDHEFISVDGNSSLRKLISEIDKIDKKSNNHSGSTMNTVWEAAQITVKKNQLIEMFPIPNTKEDLIEFLTYSISKVPPHDIAGPWKKKAEETILKSRLFFSKDREILTTIDYFEKELKNRVNPKKSLGFYIGLIFSFALMIFFCYLVYKWTI